MIKHFGLRTSFAILENHMSKIQEKLTGLQNELEIELEFLTQIMGEK